MRKNRNLYKTKKKINKGLFFVTITLLILGIISIAEVSGPQAQLFFSDSFFFVKQQIIWSVIGFCVLIVGSIIHYSFWKKIALPLLILSTLSLIAVLIPGLGVHLLGARRWINLGFFSFQPSELVKLTLALYLAAQVDSDKPMKFLIIPTFIIAILVMLQPDLGTTVVILVISFTALFLSGMNIFHLFGIGILGSILGFLAIITSNYRRDRLVTYLQGTNDPLGNSYHLRQVLLALGSGGLFGVGLGNSRQKYLFLPEASTDSVFAVIAEEIGFVGSVFLIILFIAFIFKFIDIAKDSPDRFSQVFVALIAVWIGGQMFLNIGSMIALIPLTGVPLPFFSYGGSSLITLLFAIGIVLNISRYSGHEK